MTPKFSKLVSPCCDSWQIKVGGIFNTVAGKIISARGKQIMRQRERSFWLMSWHTLISLQSSLFKQNISKISAYIQSTWFCLLLHCKCRACSSEVLSGLTHEIGNFEAPQLDMQLSGKITFILTDTSVMFQQALGAALSQLWVSQFFTIFSSVFKINPWCEILQQ